MTTTPIAARQLSRRAFLSGSSLVLSGAAFPHTLFGQEPKQSLRVGLVTDLHHADKDTSGSRHYRESQGKLATAARQFTAKPLDFLVELGDFIDAADSVEQELGYLKTINKDFAAICRKRHYVLGNHCVHTLKKQEFLNTVQQKKSYYSFDVAGFHFIVLDACFRKDGTPYGRKNFKWTDTFIPEAEIKWLEADLNAARKPTIVFAHQRLDVANNYGVANAPVIRKLLERSGNVRAVFQGHSHKNDHKEINGIHYCTMVAMVEGTGPANNGFSLMHLANDGTIRIEGFVRQRKYNWPA